MNKNSTNRNKSSLYAFFAVAVGLIFMIILGLAQQEMQKARPDSVAMGGEYLPSIHPSITLLFPVTGEESTPTPEGYVGQEATAAGQPSEASPIVPATDVVPVVPPTEVLFPTEAPPPTALPTQEQSVPIQPTAEQPTAAPLPDNTTPTVITEQPSETPAESLTPALSETVIVTGTPTMITTSTAVPAAEDLSWSVEVEVPVANQDVSLMGGTENTKEQLAEEVVASVDDSSVVTDVQVESRSSSITTFQVSLAGEDGLEQFRQAIMGDLSSQIGLFGDAVMLELSGDVKAGETWPLLLESNPTTGYIWKVVNVDGSMLEVTSEDDFNPKYEGLGAPAVQTIRFKGLANGQTTLTLFYGRPWMGMDAANTITINAGESLPEEMDLSVEVTAGDSSPGTATELDVVPPVASSLGLPASFDYKSQGLTTPVRNQGGCGSCWAFSTVGVMEAAIKRQGGGDVDLSEQYLVSCNNSGWSCNGGWFAHDYHISRYISPQTQAGAVLESAMPYTATNGSCGTALNHPYKAANWYSIAGYTVPTVDQIKNAIYNYGPVSVAVCVGSGFSSYRSGVFSTEESSACSGGVNHAVVLTGWDDSTQSWVMRNSWGSGWGESGYMRIKWGTSKVGYAASYVVYQSSSPTVTPGGPTLTPSNTPVPTNTPAPTATPVPPSNDIFDNSALIIAPNNTFATSQDISGATQAADDPTYACVSRKGYKTVWYRFLPSANGTINVDTNGSNYDTILGVWQGTRGSLTSLGCNDDINYPSNYASAITGIPVTFGETYYIEGASYGSIANGTMKLNLAFTPPPAAPVLVDPANGSSTQITTPTFNWAVSAGATGYILELSTDPGFGSVMYTSEELAGISIVSPLTLTEGRYYWHIKARNAAGIWGEFGTAWAFNIDLTAPSVPQLSQPENGTETNIITPTLSWQAAEGAQFYQMQVDNDTDFSSIIYTSPSITSTSAQTLGLTAGNYNWRVRAGDAAGNWSVWSDARQFVIDLTPPSAPGLSTPVNGGLINNRTPTFTWQTPSGAISYQVQLSKLSTFKTLIASSPTLEENSYTLPNSLDAVKYFWRVRASDQAGNWSSWSGAYLFTVDFTPPPIPGLSSPKNGIVAKTAPKLIWKASKTANGYFFELSRDPGFTSIVYNQELSATSLVLPITLGDGTFYWHVKARDAAGNWSAYGPVWSIIIDLTPPAIPQLSGMENGLLTTNKTPTFSWSRVDTAKYYQVQVGRDMGFSSVAFTSKNLGSTSTKSPKLGDGTYYWHVRAVDTIGNWSEWSNANQFTIDTTKPPVPVLRSLLSGTASGNSPLQFTWDTSFGASNYEFQLDNSAKFNSPEISAGAIVETAYSSTTTLAPMKYYWRVRARDLAGNWSAWSKALLITIQ